MTTPQSPNPSNQEPAELAQVRAEVARALSTHPPDIVKLSAALERVETLLARARADLASIVREVQAEQSSDPFPRPTRDIVWW